jgi:hypothetical protein
MFDRRCCSISAVLSGAKLSNRQRGRNVSNSEKGLWRDQNEKGSVRAALPAFLTTNWRLREAFIRRRR